MPVPMWSASASGALSSLAGLSAAAPPRAEMHVGRITNLQILRAVAALSVALHHAGALLSATRGDDRFLHLFNYNLGAFGVALFFAMSGFLMAHLIRSTEPARFLAHRVVRLYPIFVVVAVLLHLLPILPETPALRLLTLSLIPVGPHTYMLGVEWSLLYELTFYVVLYGLAVLGLARRIEAVAAIWLLVIAVASLTGANTGVSVFQPRFPVMLLSEVNVAFAAGLLLPAAIRRGLLPRGLAAAAIPASIAALAWGVEARWPTGLLAALVAAAAVQLPQLSADKAGPLRGMVRLGDWSYALYLVHMPLMFALVKAAPASTPNGVLFGGSIALSLAATLALGPLDTWLYRRVRAGVDRLPRRPLAVASLGLAALYLGVAGFQAVRVGRAEAVDDVARAAIARLPPALLADSDALQAGLAEGPGRAPATFVSGIDRVDRLPTGQSLVVGWAADLTRTGEESRLVLVCSGRIVSVARPERYRPDVAARLGNRDLRRHRIGYTAALEPGACPEAGMPLFVFVDAAGRLQPARLAAAPGRAAP